MNQFKKLTAQEIINIFVENDINIEDFAWSEESSILWTDKNKLQWQSISYSDAILRDQLRKEFDKKAEAIFELLPKWKEVAKYGGEGMGNTWYSIKHFPDHDVYLKVTGYHQSHYGTDIDGWDSVKEVKPEEKTITVYE